MRSMAKGWWQAASVIGKRDNRRERDREEEKSYAQLLDVMPLGTQERRCCSLSAYKLSEFSFI
jgi:hypothetical protein